MKHCKQLTYEKRCQIETLKNSGCTQLEIAATEAVTQAAIELRILNKQLRRRLTQ